MTAKHHMKIRIQKAMLEVAADLEAGVNFSSGSMQLGGYRSINDSPGCVWGQITARVGASPREDAYDILHFFENVTLVNKNDALFREPSMLTQNQKIHLRNDLIAELKKLARSK